MLNRISELGLDLIVKHDRVTKIFISLDPGKFPVLCDHLFEEIIPDSKSYLERCSTFYSNRNCFIQDSTLLNLRWINRTINGAATTRTTTPPRLNRALKSSHVSFTVDTLNRRALNYDISVLGGIIWAVKRAGPRRYGNRPEWNQLRVRSYATDIRTFTTLEVDRVKLGNKANTDSTAYWIPNGFSFTDPLGDVTEWITLNDHVVLFVLAIYIGNSPVRCSGCS